MGVIDWLVNIDPSTRVGAGFGFVCMGLLLGVLALSRARDWPARPPTPPRPRSHARRWWRRGDRSPVGAILGRLAAERAAAARWADVASRVPAGPAPAGVPLAIAARPHWAGDTSTLVLPRVR